MSLRVTAVTLLVIFLSGYAWFRSWFVALCGAIVLLAFLEHPDMRVEGRMIMGIPGLGLWNLLYLNVLLAWLVQRPREDLEWDLPRSLTIAFILYLSVVILAFLRLIIS